MIRLLLFVLIAAAAVMGAVWLADRPGDFSVDWLGWHVSMPIPMLLLAISLVVIVGALLYRAWRWMTAVPGEIVSWRRESKREKGYRALTQGMVAVAAGDRGEAQQQARRADVLLNEPPLTMLLSAQAAQLNGDEDAAKRYFTAMLERPETAFLGLRGLLMQAQREGDDTEALRLAARAKALQPKTPWVLKTLLELQLKQGPWRQAQAALNDAVKGKALDAADAARLRTAVQLGCSVEAEEQGDRNGALDFAKKAHADAPANIAATVRYATLLAAAGKTGAMERLARDAWIRTPHPDLVRLYRAAGKEKRPVDTVKRVEKLIAGNQSHIESQIALARAYLDAGIWGAARTHLEAACGDDPPARVCRMMAELEESEMPEADGSHGGDAEAARRWLMRASVASPDPAWVCSECGAEAAEWSPRCPNCAAPGTLNWRVRTRTPAQAEPAMLATPKTPETGAGNLPAPVLVGVNDSTADDKDGADSPPMLPPALSKGENR